MEPDVQQLTRREKRELKRQRRALTLRHQARSGKAKKFATVVATILVVGGGLAWLVWTAATRAPTAESDIITRTGLHWHPELAVYIKGVQRDIPANIGIGAVHQPVHTHDDDGVIHLEFSGLVTRADLRLGVFFKNWGKAFSSTCIFEHCSGPEGTVTMTVNGDLNTDFERYIMRDKDKIEIRYE